MKRRKGDFAGLLRWLMAEPEACSRRAFGNRPRESGWLVAHFACALEGVAQGQVVEVDVDVNDVGDEATLTVGEAAGAAGGGAVGRQFPAFSTAQNRLLTSAPTVLSAPPVLRRASGVEGGGICFWLGRDWGRIGWR